MPYYRIYMLDYNHRIVTGSDANCLNDEAAFAWAATTLGPDARAEIWLSTRFVGRLSGVSIELHRGHVRSATGG